MKLHQCSTVVLSTSFAVTVKNFFRKIKRTRKIPESYSRKVAAVSPILKKADRRPVDNYRTFLLLINIYIYKFLRKCIHETFYPQNEKYLTAHQHCFTEKKSVVTLMLGFFIKIQMALDK